MSAACQQQRTTGKKAAHGECTADVSLAWRVLLFKVQRQGVVAVLHM
jgi:hypothetical protein